MLVWPKDAVVRKSMKHPAGWIAFRDNGPADWPADSFTARRIADGDVLLHDPNELTGQTEPPDAE